MLPVGALLVAAEVVVAVHRLQYACNVQSLELQDLRIRTYTVI